MKKTGILITHGTDTMAWTHAYLRYSIKNNYANIAITGSQIPLPALGDFSDAYINIGNSLRFLTNINPPNIFAVFNYGSDAFSDSLHKINRWDNVAFTGDLLAKMEWDEIKYFHKSVDIVRPEPLEKLFLITTGGTIESVFNDEGVLVPSENHLLGFIATKFSTFYKEIAQKPVFAIDSSDLTFEKMKAIADKVGECLMSSGGIEQSDFYVDDKFSGKIKIIYTDPFKKTADYMDEVKGAEAVIVAGYGGGNINIDDFSDYNVLPIIKELAYTNIPVVLTSQVAVGPADFVYQNAWEAIKAGAISGVDLSIPEIQIRLAYLLGHREELLIAAEFNFKSFMHIFEWMFLSGMKFRTKKSRRMYENFRRFDIIEDDILIRHSFMNSLEYFNKKKI